MSNQWQMQETQHPPYDEQTQWISVPPPPPPPPPGVYGEYQLYPYGKISEYRPGTLFRIVKGFFYFLATVIIALGFFGVFESYGYNSFKRIVGLFFMFVLMAAGVALFIYMRRRITKLRRGHYIIWTVGATVALIIAWMLEFAIYPGFSNTHDPLASTIFFSFFLLYGLAEAAIAFW